MKNPILFILILLVFSMTTMAQNKRVAILETIDKENKVPYAVEVMVRSNLTKVISNTEGYEGYDRVNISEIMDEHDFERTGLVSEEQIRQLGVISGADYLLVLEAVKVDESNIFVTAKILNVESAKTESSENALMGMTALDIQHGCESLANRLLGLPDPIALKNEKSSNSGEQFVQTNDQQPKEQPIQVPVVTENIEMRTPNISFSTYPITRQGNTYYQNGKRLSNEEYAMLLKSCPQALSRARGGILVIVLGSLAMGGGIGGMVGGIIEEEKNYVTIGGLVALGSIPIVLIGNSMQRNAYKVYNRNCAQSSVSLGVYPTANGIGICLNF